MSDAPGPDAVLRNTSREELNVAIAYLESRATEIESLKSHLGEGPRQAEWWDRWMPVVVSLEGVAWALRSYAEIASGETEIDALLTEIETPDDAEEADARVRCLNLFSVSEAERRLAHRRDRNDRLRALSAPQVILDNDTAMLLEAEAGLAWARARELRLQLGAGPATPEQEEGTS